MKDFMMILFNTQQGRIAVKMLLVLMHNLILLRPEKQPINVVFSFHHIYHLNKKNVPIFSLNFNSSHFQKRLFIACAL